MLTEKMVHAADRRAIFVTADAYKTADGIILQSLDETGDRSQQKEPGANWLFAPLPTSKTAHLFSMTRKRPKPEPSSAFATTACC